MSKGDNVLITYAEQDNKTVLATFYEHSDSKYFFKDIHGIFAVSENAIQSGTITFEVIEE